MLTLTETATVELDQAQDDVEQALRGAGWAGVVGRLRVRRHAGVTTVSGCVGSFYQKQAVCCEIRRMPGVGQIDDRLEVLCP